ncbi:MAG: threonylcarbamoyl-AMP synthase [Clostridiales bacterium]|nr:threonylcarbamoyl-AMP synthase [Clostridiales bacterium]
MDTELVGVDAIDRAAALIAHGELVAFPTETVYGLGGNALDPAASAKIYAAKGRPSDNPLIVHIADMSQLKEAACRIPPQANLLAEAFWPGPLTMILWKNPQVPTETTGGLDSVAVRMPSHPVAQELIRKSGCMIAAPSANASGRPSPTEASHVMQDLGGRISMIIDGGTVGIGIESTIIDLTEDIPMILRPGYITLEEISEVLGEKVIYDPAIIADMNPGQKGSNKTKSTGLMQDTHAVDGKESSQLLRPKAPGMRYRHYAPKAQMLLVSGEAQSVVAEINRRIHYFRDNSDAMAEAKEGRECSMAAGGAEAQDVVRYRRIAVIASEETGTDYPEADVVFTIGSRSDEDAIARHLYGILRECDEAGVDLIYSEAFATPRLGQAIMNRMLKAAGHQVIYV